MSSLKKKYLQLLIYKRLYHLFTLLDILQKIIQDQEFAEVNFRLKLPFHWETKVLQSIQPKRTEHGKSVKRLALLDTSCLYYVAHALKQKNIVTF